MKQNGASWQEITLAMMPRFPDKTFAQVREMVRKPYRAAKQGECYTSPAMPIGSYGESVEHRKDGTVVHDRLIEICEGEEITPEVLLRAHNLDPKQWQVVAYRNNRWHSQTAGERLVMYQSRVTVKPYQEGEISLVELEEHFKHLDRKYVPRRPKHRKRNSGRMLEVNIADLHLGKLAWHGETGENYDYKIARERFFQVIDQETQRAAQGNYEKIVFVWCNDFFNSDGQGNQTTAGTPQDTDVRWQKLFTIGCEMLVDAITQLSEHAPVETFYIASNHAKQAEYYAVKYLEAWFRNDPNVTINADATPRQYMLFGNVLLGFTHGSYEAKNKLKSLMSVEVPELWAQATWREMHVAHIHSEKVEEDAGLIIRHCPTVTGTDAWHNLSGYVGAMKRSYSYEWDKVYGLIAMNCVAIGEAA
ncbi:hypothetical protein LJC20_00430 [Eubacteriales bacterium OttesenSCG-928-M02]|nr:hypothetical protein [Eubacteriales bacterium OttesenSCG-928-M02]